MFKIILKKCGSFLNQKNDNISSHLRSNYTIPNIISKDYSKNGINEDNYFDTVLPKSI